MDASVACVDSKLTLVGTVHFLGALEFTAACLFKGSHAEKESLTSEKTSGHNR